MLSEFMEVLRGIGEKILERKSYIVLVCGFGFLAGVILHAFFDVKVGSFWLYNLMLAAGSSAVIFWSNKKARLILLSAFFIVAGFARFDLSVPRDDFKKFFGREIKIQALVVDEPINKIDKQQLVVLSREISDEKILVTTGLFPKYAYGDKLSFYCKLVRPKEFSDFDYARYLSIHNIGALCYWPAVRSLDEERPEISVIPAIRSVIPKFIPAEAGTQGNPVNEAGIPGSRIKSGMTLRGTGMMPREYAMAQILNFKNFLIGKVSGAMPEPYASFLSGLVLGARSAMPPRLLDDFQRAGITHIIAISGWNISFLSFIFLPALFYLRIPRGRAFYVMLVFIFLYAILTGASASVIRAAIMGSTLLLAQKMGRLNSGGRALLYAAAAMLLINPRVIYDAGFYLSASAAFGLIYFAPIIDARLKITSPTIKSYISATVTAVIFTLPVSSYVFKSISLWALPVNLLVLPFVPVAFVASLLGMVLASVLPAPLEALGISSLTGSAGLAAISLWPAAAILNYIIWIAGFFGRLPIGYLEWQMPIIIVVAYYAALLAFTFKKLKEGNEEIF